MSVVIVEKLACGCQSWIDGVDVHVRACSTPGHHDVMLAAAKASGLPIAEGEPL